MQTIDINGKQIGFNLKTVGGSLFLEATHINGEESYAGNLIRIDSDGRFHRCTSVNSDFGFKLNDVGQIKQNKEGVY